MRRNHIVWLLCLALFAAALCQGALASEVKADSVRYDDAVGLFNLGKYESAIKLFAGLMGYEQSADYLSYAQGALLLEEGDFEKATAYFSLLGSFLDSEAMASYAQARRCEQEGATREAYDLYAGLDVMDSAERAQALEPEIEDEPVALVDAEPIVEIENTPVQDEEEDYGEWQEVFDTSGYTELAYQSADKAGVKALQERLAELGYLDNANGKAVDGDYGNMTRNAVAHFQAGSAQEVTGVATPDTQARLFSGTAKAASQVIIAPTSLEMDSASVTVNIGRTKAVEITAEPAYATYSLAWTSSDPAIATVDQDGVVIGIARGEATITATDTWGRVLTCTAKVTQYAPSAPPKEPNSNPGRRKF